MKALTTLLTLVALVGVLSGCSTITMPPAEKYFIRVQDNPNEIQANSVRVRGDWIVVEKDAPKEMQFFRRSSVIWIRAFQPQ